MSKNKKSKWLYNFKINRDVEKKVTEKSKDEDGKDIEVTKTVTETVPINFYIRMHPNLEKIKWSYVSDILKIKGKNRRDFKTTLNKISAQLITKSIFSSS